MRRTTPMILATALSIVLLVCAGLFVTRGDANGDDVGAAPNVTFVYFDGTEGSLAELVGKPTVINFFASWCGPCVLEMPDFEEAFQLYGGQVNFLGFNTQDDINDGRHIVRETGISYPVAHDTDGVIYVAFGGFGMPTTVLLNSDGGIVEMHTGLLQGNLLHEKIETELLG